ncbi:hypothetical protein [Bacillus xiamenensis]|uniref:hypothetical protein n=1 Tax=Bacillus xiamenensis TaxID=1178537 RepID=UPI000AA4E1C1|nr:hypothetical protein [Bacillus xiamenensis]
MAFTKEIPQWDNAGQKPPQSKISEGFKPMDHPPADWFNWYMNGTYEALNELQSKAAATTEVTAGLKVLSNDIAAHSNAKNNPHAVTKSQVGLGNVDNIKQASKADFDSHATDKILHTSEVEKSKWNNGQLYKLTQDNGLAKLIPDGTDLLTLPPGLYYGINNRLLNNPDPTDTGWFYYDIRDGGSGRKMILATASFKNTMWHATVHTNGVFRGWKRLITDGDAVATWKTPSLSKGWKQYVSSDGFPHTLRYTKDAFGVVEIIGSITGGVIGNDVEAFTLLDGYLPLQSMHFIGVASSLGTPGVPQYHRTYIGTDGRVCVQSCSNTVNPNEFITFGFRFKAK